jgi:hypothetical protein
MLEVQNGRFWGGEAFLRPYLLWQCQLGTVPYTAQLKLSKNKYAKIVITLLV